MKLHHRAAAPQEGAHGEPCFACGKKLRGTPKIVDTSDRAQRVFVGPDCYRKIVEGGADGYQPPRGGPRLYLTARGA